MQQILEDKRKYYRHPMTVPVELKEIRSDLKYSNSAQSTDLSERGLCFFCDQPFSKGALLIVQIPIKKQHFEIHARVAYSEKDSKTGFFRTGVFFQDSTSAFQAKIAEEIIEIQKYRKKLSSELGHEISEEEAAKKWIKKYAYYFTKTHF